MSIESATSVRIYSPGEVGLACFIGSPLAACCLMTLTYGALQEPKKAKRCLVYGIAGTVVVIVLAFVLPESVPSSGIAVGSTVALYQIAKQVHGPVVATHRAQGGHIGAWGFVVGVGFLGLAVVFAVIVGIDFILARE